MLNASQKTSRQNTETQPCWTASQQRFIEFFQQEEHRSKTIGEICKLLGYHPRTWYHACKSPHFVAAVEALGVKVQRNKRVVHRLPQKRLQAKNRFLELLQSEENKQRSLLDVWKQTGCSEDMWYKVLKDEPFVAMVEASSGRRVRRKAHESHIDVTPAKDIEEDLAQDTWDMRRLKSTYPKHQPPSTFEVDFTWITNSVLRSQIKRYFRHRLSRWGAASFRRKLYNLKPALTLLPSNIHMGCLERNHIEAILPTIWKLPRTQAYRCLLEMKQMITYMATSLSWPGPRPPRHLIWEEELPSKNHTLPRPIPPDVLDQLDVLLEKNIQAMEQGKTPDVLSPMMWDALLILRRTGMRSEDLAHLKAPDSNGRNGCLDQDSEGYWWIRIYYLNTKMGRDHRIPTRQSDGVVDAIHRQRVRSADIPDHFHENFLFRIKSGILSYASIADALRRLAPLLQYEGGGYVVVPHQFRHSIATDMIEQGVDIYTVKEFLGHKSLAMTEKYVEVYLKSLKTKFDAYRAKKQQTYASEMLTTQVTITQSTSQTDGGWVDGKVGKLYRSPLPDGIGHCVHLPMHDGCPKTPHCPTCPKLQASKRHLAIWENKAKNLQLTVEALGPNPAFERARQKHEYELRHAEKVIKDHQRGGVLGWTHPQQLNEHALNNAGTMHT